MDLLALLHDFLSLDKDLVYQSFSVRVTDPRVTWYFQDYDVSAFAIGDTPNTVLKV